MLCCALGVIHSASGEIDHICSHQNRASCNFCQELAFRGHNHYIGTSGIVEPVASLLRLAEKRGATIVVNNLEVEISSTAQAYYLNRPAGTILPLIVWPESE